MKDPAVLFYPGDYICETMGMSRVERDCYMDLYILQFNQYHFTKEMAKNVLKEDFERVWENIKGRFIEEGEYFYNGNLRAGIAKRRAYTASRKAIADKRKKKGETMEENQEQEKIKFEEEKKDQKIKDNEIHVPVQKRDHLSPGALVNGCQDIWEKMTEAKRKAYKEDIWQIFVGDKTFIRNACKTGGWMEKDFERALKDFLKEQAITEDINRGEKALKRHFINKYKKSIKV